MVLPEGILFDAGGTLVLQHPGEVGRMLGLPIDPDEAFDAHYRTMHEFSLLLEDGGEATWDWWLERYFERLRHPSPIDAGPAIRRGYMLWTWAIPGVVEAILQLADRGIKVGVISNSDGSVEESLRRAGFEDVFEFVLDSEVVGVKKPSRRIFEMGCDRLGVDPDRCWYVGDSMHHDVTASRRAGFESSWLIDPLALRPEETNRIRSVADIPAIVTGN
jgi:HAD superfamily hydrolase (TIGR01509 family)